MSYLQKTTRWVLLTVLAFLTPSLAWSGQKVLIFHGSVGMGHTAAAKGVAADLLKKDPTAEVVVKDLRDFMGRFTKGPSNWLYDVMTQKAPRLYDASFRDYMDTGARLKSIGDMPLTQFFNPKAVLQYVEAERPDVILSTFPSATEVLVHLRDQGKLTDIPIGWVHTDLVDETYFARMPLQIEMAFVATPRIEKSWVQRGVPSDRVLASGMPLNPKVLQPENLEEVSAFKKVKQLDPKKRTILLLGGSNGVGDYPLMVESILRAFGGEPIQLVAVCGRNENHLKNLSANRNRYARQGLELVVEPLIPQDVLFNYMHAADAIISKTGGLTPMELFYKKKPLVLLDINGGQERYNADDFASTGLAKVTKNQSTVGDELKQMLDDPKIARQQIEKQIEFSRNNQPGKIADWILSRPQAKAPLHKTLFIKNLPDYPRPKGLWWDCIRLFKPAPLLPNSGVPTG